MSEGPIIAHNEEGEAVHYNNWSEVFADGCLGGEQVGDVVENCPIYIKKTPWWKRLFKPKKKTIAMIGELHGRTIDCSPEKAKMSKT